MRGLFMVVTTEVEDEKTAAQKILAIQEMVRQYGMKVEIGMLSPCNLPVSERRS